VCKGFFTICSANWVIGHYSHGIKNLFTTHVHMLSHGQHRFSAWHQFQMIAKSKQPTTGKALHLWAWSNFDMLEKNIFYNPWAKMWALIPPTPIVPWHEGSSNSSTCTLDICAKTRQWLSTTGHPLKLQGWSTTVIVCTAAQVQVAAQNEAWKDCNCYQLSSGKSKQTWGLAILSMYVVGWLVLIHCEPGLIVLPLVLKI